MPNNIYFNPIELKKLCQIILKIKNKKIYGTYNLGGKRITKFNFAIKIATKNNLNKNLVIPYKSKLKDIKTTKYINELYKIGKET